MTASHRFLYGFLDFPVHRQKRVAFTTVAAALSVALGAANAAMAISKRVSDMNAVRQINEKLDLIEQTLLTQTAELRQQVCKYLKTVFHF